MAERIGRPARLPRRKPRRAGPRAIERAARGRDNLMPLILDAVRARVTLGEICDSLRTVFVRISRPLFSGPPPRP